VSRSSAVSLSFRDMGGDGPPIVILHGLFGSSQNWASVGRRLASIGHCLALDLRNHGDSPHHPSHTLSDCIEDVSLWCERHEPRPVTLIGHSMGGLVAMGFAIARPDRIERLVVVDIAPRVYPIDHEREFAALAMDISGCAARGELDERLRPVIPEDRLRAFILTNAVRSDGGFHWRCNTEALRKARLFSDFSGVHGQFGGEVLFLVGGRSDEVKPEDGRRIKQYFPRAEVSVIAEGDHWMHVSAQDSFLEALESFLKKRNRM
jgi:esterase